MKNIHDNTLTSYVVDFEKSTIVLKTKSDLDSNEYVDIIFENVFTHYFKNQLNGSVLFDITEDNINEFLKDNLELLDKSKNSSWPMMYNTLDELINTIYNGKYKYFLIGSSYGITGWILATKFKIV